MSLNISDNESTPERRQLVEELTTELTSWSPREFLFAFRRMHRGAVSLIHLNVLIQIEADGPMAMGRLAEALDVSVASVTGIVTRMEARGLVERVHTDHDRRVVIVQQTETGADVFRSIQEHRRDGLRRLLGNLSDAELSGFLAGHRALRAARLSLVQESSGLVSVRVTDADAPADGSAEQEQPPR